MRNLLSLIGLVVVVFVGCGWYFKWYTFSVAAGSDGKKQITVDVDTKQIGRNLGEAKDKLGQFLATPEKPEPAAAPEFVGPPAPTKR